MEFINKTLTDYCNKHSETETDILTSLNRETHLKVLSPRMLSGHLQGRFLSFISKLTKPSNILEIGTYTGYSALCLAEGLTVNGKLITIDPNEETNALALSYFNKSPFKEQIELLCGQAANIIPNLNSDWDLVFIDADKGNYSLYFDLIIDKVKKGGVIIADNVLWSGKVTEPENKMDRDTIAIHRFNEKVNTDKRVSNILLPIRDGLMVMIKN